MENQTSTEVKPTELIQVGHCDMRIMSSSFFPIYI